MKCPTCDGNGWVLDADAAHDMRQVRDQCPDCGGSGVRANEGYADEVERVRNDAHRAIVAILEAVGGTVIVSRNVLESIDYNTVVSMYERPLSGDVVWTTKEGGA